MRLLQKAEKIHKNKSCQANLVSAFDEIISFIEKGNKGDISLDFSKAFDITSHQKKSGVVNAFEIVRQMAD